MSPNSEKRYYGNPTFMEGDMVGEEAKQLADKQWKSAINTAERALETAKLVLEKAQFSPQAKADAEKIVAVRQTELDDLCAQQNNPETNN